MERLPYILIMPFMLDDSVLDFVCKGKIISLSLMSLVQMRYGWKKQIIFQAI